jgi:hypothetical protein
VSLPRLLSASAAALLLWAAAQQSPTPPPPLRWYKGNLHTHTLNSDGDSTPLEVANWYRDHRYHFLVLTDHNFLTDPAPLNAVAGAPERFLLIPGEEVTTSYDNRPVHINAIGAAELILPVPGATIVETLRRNIALIQQKNAMPSVNHPNFRWAFTSRELLQVPELTHFEVYNGHPTVHNNGGGGAESLDQMWDALLSAGRRVHGVAVDDAHSFKQFRKDLSNPGRGWVTVRAPSLETANIMRALHAGDFYASTGVELEDLHASREGLKLKIRQAADFKYVTKFIGSGGKVLKTDPSMTPEYRLAPADRYVRARVEASNGDTLWTQAVFNEAPSPAR